LPKQLVSVSAYGGCRRKQNNQSKCESFHGC
jgi:hypothetical protein